MRLDLLLLFLLAGAGNYLMRSVPLLLALRRTTSEEPGTATSGTSGVLLSLVGPSVVAALLVTSVLPEASGSGAELARYAVALLITLIIAIRYGNLGLTVLTGVLAYGLISLLT